MCFRSCSASRRAASAARALRCRLERSSLLTGGRVAAIGRRLASAALAEARPCRALSFDSIAETSAALASSICSGSTAIASAVALEDVARLLARVRTASISEMPANSSTFWFSAAAPKVSTPAVSPCLDWTNRLKSRAVRPSSSSMNLVTGVLPLATSSGS
ncbi:hypothetical protein D9M69_608570 [compost metagenome]